MAGAIRRNANWLVLLACAFWALVLPAQMDTIHHLPQMEVTAQRIDLTDIGKHTEDIDSSMIAVRGYENLAALLSSGTPLFIRSYGPGQLATAGIRGGGAAHTQILWNGIPLRNPMIGLLDLSLLPASFFDAASVHYGGHGAAFGSGAMGALISIDNSDLTEKNGIEFSSGFGSWSHRFGNARFIFGTEHLRFSTRVFAQNALNNFRYRLNDQLPQRRQVHHHLTNRGLMQEAEYTFTDAHKLTARIWYQFADRQIPPTSVQTMSQSAQQDENLRTSLQWDFRNKKFQGELKAAFLDERIDYQDSLILLFTHNRFKTWLAEASVSFRLTPALHFTGGVYSEIARSQSANYSDRLTRDQNAVFTSLRFITKNLVWRMQLREEITSGDWSPLLIDFSNEGSFTRDLQWKASVSRNYRTPTMNDLFWRPGGNPSLIPEEGWTYEAGLQFRKQQPVFGTEVSVTAYSRNVNNWIMWMPPVKDVSFFWSPLNITRVKSEGLEARAKTGVVKENSSFEFRFGMDLTWSTFEEPLQEFNIQQGDQLFYIPVENILTGLNLQYKNITLQYDHHWYGRANGINENLAPFNTGNLGIHVKLLFEDAEGHLFMRIDNIWDTPYRIIERRPMPGRSFTAGAKFSFL